MPTPTEIQCSIIWQAAAASTLGLVIRTNDPFKARAALYKFRNSMNDPTLAALSIRVSPDNSESEIWILTNRTETVNVGDIL